MNDPLLGDLRADPALGGSWVGSIRCEDRDLALRIDPDGEDLAVCIELAKEMVRSLKALQEMARQAASRKLLENYNENWRHLLHLREDGSTEEISKPKLTSEVFERQLRLVSLGVVGDAAEFCFSDGELFHGHSIVVTVFDGAVFEDVHVALIG